MNENFFARGGERAIYNDPEKPEIILKETKDNKDNPRLHKATFYLNKILHILFPENIPNIHGVRTAGDKTVINVEKITWDENHAELMKLIDSHRKNPPKEWEDPLGDRIFDIEQKIYEDPDVQNLVSKIRSMGISPDTYGRNFIKTPEGKWKYIDTDMAWSYDLEGIKLNFDFTLLEEAVKEIKSDNDRENGQKWLARLRILFEQEKNFIKNN